MAPNLHTGLLLLLLCDYVWEGGSIAGERSLPLAEAIVQATYFFLVEFIGSELSNAALRTVAGHVLHGALLREESLEEKNLLCNTFLVAHFLGLLITFNSARSVLPDIIAQQQKQ